MEGKDNSDNNGEHEHFPKLKKSRGMTTGLKAQKVPGPKIIQFDDNGDPTGDWDVKFTTDIGVIARNVKITYEEWDDVPEGHKQTIWLDIKKKWNIQDDERRKKVLQLVGNRWKDFKSSLTTYYVYKTKPQRRKVQLDDPLSVYSMITKEDWETFVKQRMDPTFKERSEKARLASLLNRHPHHLGRTPYAKKIKQWHEDEVNHDITLSLNDDPNDPYYSKEDITTRVTERLSDRGYVWVKAHTPSTGNPPPQTEEVIENIKYWSEKAKIGEFVPSGREDVLVKATDKLDHPGRTRGVGKFVGHQKYFGKSSRRGPCEKLYTADDLRLFKEEIRRESMAEMKIMLNQQLLELAASNSLRMPDNYEINDKGPNPSPTRDQSSCYYGGQSEDPFVKLTGRVWCQLAQYVGENTVIVAEGDVFPWEEGKMVHNIPLSPKNAHVSIDMVIDPTASLPVPFAGYKSVGEVQGSFAQWPK